MGQKRLAITALTVLLLGGTVAVYCCTRDMPRGQFRIQTLDDPPPEDRPLVNCTSRTWNFTCSACGSTMSCGDEHPTEETEIRFFHESASASNCPHDWRKGISSAHPSPVPDGTVVLVKRGGAYGALVLEGQTTTRIEGQTVTPEGTMFRWWFRTDGDGHLDAGPPWVKSGAGGFDAKSNPGTELVFGPFTVRWSANMDGWGWIYYAVAPGKPVPAGAALICVTELKDIAGLDASDPRWRYKGAPID